jgi:N6-L-threonylcarbamoyladenine synthase
MKRLPDDFTILALETSCDETAAAVVRGGRIVISNIVASQMATHERYGGVVPEIASRQHILSLAPVVRAALAALPNGWNDVHAVAATHGPGLSGALLTGLNAAKAMAWQRGLPFVAVNHLEAHLYAGWLGSDPPPPFPLVALLVSGGHTLLALIHDHGQYELLGQTRDDAAGEAFDKVARILGLGYPGGPAIQAAAAQATPGGVLPRAWLRDSYDFSFSGLKTAVLHRVQDRLAQAARLSGRKGSNETPQLDAPFVAQMAYAFQESVVDVLVTKTVDAARRFKAQAILLAGGVAANRRLREELKRRSSVPVHLPELELCTDNAAMVAAAAFYRFETGVQHSWDVDVTASLPLGA